MLLPLLLASHFVSQAPAPPRQPNPKEYVGPNEFMLNQEYKIDLMVELLRKIDPAINLNGLRMKWGKIGPFHTEIHFLEMFRCKLLGIRSLMLTDLHEYPPQSSRARGVLNGIVIYQEPLSNQFNNDIEAGRALIKSVWTTENTRFDVYAKASNAEPSDPWKTIAHAEIINSNEKLLVKFMDLKGAILGIFILGDPYHTLTLNSELQIEKTGPFSNSNLYQTFERLLLPHQMPVQYDCINEAKRYFGEIR